MTGITEILVLIFLILAVLILPRLLKPAPNPKEVSSLKMVRLSPLVRAGIIISIIWPVAAALYIKPWTGHLVPFLSIGVLPVFAAWSIVWILSGKKK